jgi:dTDP-4-dehydrorhamnose 3,5-epimerase
MTLEFLPGKIDGVIWYPLKKYHDQRGWLCELFRHDDIPEQFHPVMAYISMTEPGVARGPHEHADQADYFCFLGPSNFKLYLWDNRPPSPTHRVKQAEVVGQDNPMAVIIPPGVVHAYMNVGSSQGIVFNCPNRLYRGHKRSQPVDEIRHEDHAETLYQLD